MSSPRTTFSSTILFIVFVHFGCACKESLNQNNDTTKLNTEFILIGETHDYVGNYSVDTSIIGSNLRANPNKSHLLLLEMEIEHNNWIEKFRNSEDSIYLDYILSHSFLDSNQIFPKLFSSTKFKECATRYKLIDYAKRLQRSGHKIRAVAIDPRTMINPIAEIELMRMELSCLSCETGDSKNCIQNATEDAWQCLKKISEHETQAYLRTLALYNYFNSGLYNDTLTRMENAVQSDSLLFLAARRVALEAASDVIYMPTGSYHTRQDHRSRVKNLFDYLMESNLFEVTTYHTMYTLDSSCLNGFMRINTYGFVNDMLQVKFEEFASSLSSTTFFEYSEQLNFIPPGITFDTLVISVNDTHLYCRESKKGR